MSCYILTNRFIINCFLFLGKAPKQKKKINEIKKVYTNDSYEIGLLLHSSKQHHLPRPIQYNTLGNIMNTQEHEIYIRTFPHWLIKQDGFESINVSSFYKK